MKDKNTEEKDSNISSSKIKDNQVSNNKNTSKKTINEKETSQKKEKEIRIGNYLIKKTLGKGTFGKVKLGIFLPKNKKVAVKILEKKKLKEEDDLIRLKREFDMLSQFNHPNVISVSEIFESKDAYFTVMEYCEGGELFNFIVANKYLSEEKSSFFYFQLINGLEYIHSLGIVHRDLKPENLLLNEDNILKIIDFGLSNYFKQNQNQLLETPCGSPCYASPEMLSGENYDGFKIDIWATGIILFAMLCGFLPFDHKDNDKLFMKILECKINYPKHLSSEAKDLIKKILVPDPRKRITIPEIKKHPFYLKGKEIFETNFTIYQVSQEDISESNNDSSLKYYTLDNNLFFFEYNHKSEVLLNRYKFYSMNILQKRRYNSFEINRFVANNTIKNLVNIEKKIKKMQKRLKKEKNKEKVKNNIKRRYLNYNHSVTFLISDINTFCENLIKRYLKEEQRNKLIKKMELNKIRKENIMNINKSNDSNMNKIKEKLNINKKNNYNTININMDKINKKNPKIIKTKNIKEQKNKIIQINNLDIKNEKNIDNSQHININNNNPTNKTINQSYNLNNQYKNDNIKVNIKKRAPIKINKLYINNNKLPIINKLPKNIINLKKFNRNINNTNINNSKGKNFKKILDIIKQQTLKANINIINKSNIIHHHTTNITNMTQKNYYSNVIINNYKTRDDRTNYSSSHNKPKGLNFSEIQNENQKNIISEYLQKNNIPRLNLPNKNNHWKLKNNLQKIILKEDLLYKDTKIIKHNSQKKNSSDISNLIPKDENMLTIRDKKPDNNQNKENSANKTIPNTNDKKRNHIKSKISNINNYNLNNNKNYYNKKKAITINYNSLNSFRYSLMNTNNLEYINNSKRDRENKNINSFSIKNNTNTNINTSLETKIKNKQNALYRKKKLDKILSTNINLNLNIEQKLNRNKTNNSSSIDNNYSNRSYNYNKKIIDINKINNQSNIMYKINNYNNSAIKTIENKNIDYSYNNNLNKKCPKLNLKEIFGNSNNNLNKKDKEANCLSLNFQKHIQSQRNKPSIVSKTHKNININNYLNSIKNNNNKMVSTYFNIENESDIGNINSNLNFNSNMGKFKANPNNIRNKDLINLNININFNRLNKTNNNNNINMTSDNIKVNNDLIKKQTSIQPSKNNNTINTSNYNINNNRNKLNKNRINTNIYLDKFIESKKLFSSLRKRINLHSNIINNNYNTYIDNKKKPNNNSLICNYNMNQFKNNNNIIENKNSFNYNDINVINLKKNHKKIKSMKETLINPKNQNIISNYMNKENNNSKNKKLSNNLNLNGMGLYICNTDSQSINLNNVNYINILDNNFNTIDNNNYPVNRHPFSNISNLKKNNIIKKMKLNEHFKIK